MAMAKFVFRSLAREHPEPGDFLAYANDVVVDEIAPGKFITMAYVAVDPARTARSRARAPAIRRRGSCCPTGRSAGSTRRASSSASTPARTTRRCGPTCRSASTLVRLHRRRHRGAERRRALRHRTARRAARRASRPARRASSRVAVTEDCRTLRGRRARRTTSRSSSSAARALIELLRGGRGVVRVGHRGAAALAPENSLAAIEAAAAAGVDAVELDVLWRARRRASCSRTAPRSRRTRRRSTRRSRSSRGLGLAVQLDVKVARHRGGRRRRAPPARPRRAGFVSSFSLPILRGVRRGRARAAALADVSRGPARRLRQPAARARSSAPALAVAARARCRGACRAGSRGRSAAPRR